MIQKLNKDNAEKIIKNTPRIVVKFGATWCGPCKMITPVLDTLSTERTDVTFAEIDMDECPELFSEKQIKSVPTMIYFQDGIEARRCVGVKGKGEINLLIDYYDI